MGLTGDTQGIEALKKIKRERPAYLKFLISEARSNTTHSADFKAEDGTAYRLCFKIQTGDLEVEKVA
jgi:hypothetical protein